MSDEQSIRGEIAEAMIGVKSADLNWFIFGDTEDDRADTLVLADAILASPVIRRIQAEARVAAIDEVEDHLVRRDCFTERTLNLISDLRVM